MQHVRLYPAFMNAGKALKERKDECRKAKTNENEPRQNRDPLASTDDNCPCESPAFTRAECPISETEVWTIPGTEMTTRRGMATQACYMPMKEPGYRCSDFHLDVLMGEAGQSQFLRFFWSVRDPVQFRDKTDSAGNTPLMLACVARYVSFEVIDTLLGIGKSEKEREIYEKEREIYINRKNHDGFTALHFAVLNNQPEVVEKLLNYGADVNAGRVKINGKYYGLTPVLMSVIFFRQYEDRCLDELLKHNPDLSVETVKDEFDANNVLFCLECDCGGCVSSILSERELVLPPSKIRTVPNRHNGTGSALFHAAKNDLDKELRKLLQTLEGVGEVDQILDEPKHYHSLTLLGVAIECIGLQTIKVFIDRYPGIVNRFSGRDFKTYQAVTPLHQVLLNQGYPDTYFSCMYCKKVIPVQNEIKQIVKLLLCSPDIDVESRAQTGDYHYHTPLMLAVMNGHDYVIQDILESEVDPMATDASGCTAVYLALFQQTDVCLKVLRILFKTGLSHEIYNDAFAHSLTLRKLSSLEDAQILNLFCQVDALSESNRMAMLNAVNAAPVKPGQDEKRAEFLQSLQRSPPPLKQLATRFISTRAGFGTLGMRQRAVENTVSELFWKYDVPDKDDDQSRNENVGHDKKTKREEETQSGCQKTFQKKHGSQAIQENRVSEHVKENKRQGVGVHQSLCEQETRARNESHNAAALQSKMRTDSLQQEQCEWSIKMVQDLLIWNMYWVN